MPSSTSSQSQSVSDYINSTSNSSSNTSATNPNSNAAEAYSAPSGAIPAFLEKIQEWKFSPPHNNLWTVEIALHNDPSDTVNHNLLELFKNIDKVNIKYRKIIPTDWDVKNNTKDDIMNDFLNRLQGTDNDFFLAQGVSFDPKSVNIVNSLGQEGQQQRGFINMGLVETGMGSSSVSVRIQFLETNWNLSDIFFDKWIAAIGQQGLIEDSSLPCIKADMIIKEYAGSAPSSTNDTSTSATKWKLRKTTKLFNVVPVTRATFTLSYEPPTFNSVEVSFMATDYEISYQI